MRTLFSETMRNLKVNLAEIGISNFASGIGTSFTLAVAALLTSVHIIPASSLLILLFMTNEVFRPANELAAYFHQGFMGITSMGGIFALLDEEEKIKDEGTKTIDIKSADGFEIRYENIEFTYSEKKNTVFKNLNFIFTLVKVFISAGFQFATIRNKIAFFIIYFVSLLGVAYGIFAI